jgi:TolB-like protein/DNA-binding SARP family transcriptional activator
VDFQLEALGGLRLVAADGKAVHAQRRRLALLALLAAAGEHGLTRDQLVGCLWPESSQESAKHALNQLLYGLRRSLSEDAVRGVDPLQLDPDVVDSDVRRFERALSAGEFRDAVAHYRGPFLNGFYLADAPDFERWVERERARLAAAHADALEQLAAEAERQGNAAAAVTWRRARVELEPLDARRATALMRALAAAGDSPGAIAHGRTYEALVRHELDAPADPAIAALASELRAGLGTRAAVAAAPLCPPVAGVRPQPPELAEPTSHSPSNAPPAPPRSTEPAPRRRRLVLVFGLAALAAASFSARRSTRERSDPVPAAAVAGPSVAVLPLRNLSADPGDASLADGMTEELIATLSRVTGLRVIASTSVYALEERRMDVRQIAESLRVSHVLEGGLQKAGRRLRLQLRLVDARDGATLWSEGYDREMGDVFAVQDDIARSVSRELGVRLARGGGARPGARRYTPSIEAYEWYLRGTDPTLTRSGAGFRQARDHLHRAIAADSGFAAAYAELAVLYVRGATNVPAERAALKAIALDDSLAAGHAALGWVRSAQKDWAGAEAELKRAIALDPRASVPHQGMARLYLWTGRPVEQLEAARIGVEIDPFSITAVRELALALAMNGRCDEAIDLLRPWKALTPRVGLVGILSGQCHAAKGRWSEAAAEFRWAAEQTDVGMSLGFLGYALARGGQPDSAKAILADLLAGRKASNGAFGIASIYTGLGDYDEAVAWIEKAVDESSARPYIMGPMFDDLRRDPRFARVRRRLRL